MSDTAVPVDVARASYSSLTLHRKCPQAWYYRYRLGLQRNMIDPSPERDFGSWWSALRAAEALERGRRVGSLVVPPTTLDTVDGGPEFDMATVTVVDVLTAAVQWWKTQPANVKDSWIERLGEPAPLRLREAFLSWRETWAEDLKHEHPLGVEVKWERMLPRERTDEVWEGGAARVPDLILKGYVDEVYFDARRRLNVVRDHKTHKQLATMTSLDDMMDSQLQLYAWGVAPLLKELGADPVKAVAYDRTRSTAPPLPKLTLTGTLSKSTTQYDLRTYLRWAAGENGEGVPWGVDGEFFVSGKRKGEPKFGVYTADPVEIARLSTPAARSVWHQRTLVPLNRNVIASHIRAAVDSAIDIHRTELRAERLQAAPRNLTKDNCRWCDFATLCRAQMIGGTTGEYELAEHGLKSRDGAPALVVA